MNIDEAFKDNLLNLAFGGVYVYDLSLGSNVYVNKEYTALTGYTLEEINNMSQEEFFALFHPDDQAAIGAHMTEVISANPGQVIEIEYRFKKKDGSWMWCYSRDAVFAQNNEAETTQFIGRFIDVTQRMEILNELNIQNKRLNAANKELEQFKYLASHDLQEPINTIRGFTDLLLAQYSDVLGTDGTQYLTFISNSTHRMKILMQGLLQYGKLGHEFEVEECDANEIFKHIVEDLSNRIESANATVEIDANLPSFMGMAQEVQILFQNLLTNALKFNKKGVAPHVKIKAKKNQDYVVFMVEDNGIGIPEEHQEKVFEIFKRLHNHADYEGSGLGLALCQKIVERHGGKIDLTSEVGVGTTFTVHLPLHTQSSVNV